MPGGALVKIYIFYLLNSANSFFIAIRYFSELGFFLAFLYITGLFVLIT